MSRVRARKVSQDREAKRGSRDKVRRDRAKRDKVSKGRVNRVRDKGMGQQGQGGQGQGQPGAQQGGGGPGLEGGNSGGRRVGGVRNFDADEIRQLRREFRERRGETEALAGVLERSGVDPQDLQAMIAAMRALDRDRTYDDPEEVMRLQSVIVEGMKQVEFQLRRQLADEDDQILLDQDGDVPDGFKTLVEEYYRALSRGGTIPGR